MKDEKTHKWGDNAPGWKHFIIAIVAVAVLIGFAWISWFKWGWFH